MSEPVSDPRPRKDRVMSEIERRLEAEMIALAERALLSSPNGETNARSAAAQYATILIAMRLAKVLSTPNGDHIGDER